MGDTEISVMENAETQQEFFEKISFFSSLPKVGPNGETDLKFSYRKTKEGYEYFSIISEKAGQEYKFGQSQKDPGQLFAKGWEDIYVGNGQSNTKVAPAAKASVGATNVGIGNVTQPTPQTEVQPQPQQVTPAQNDVATDVLAQFGIGN